MSATLLVVGVVGSKLKSIDMTDKQMTEYEYCKAYLFELKSWTEQLPFTIQNFGCGSRQPPIEHDLERIHRTMFEDVRASINKVIKEVEEKITKI